MKTYFIRGVASWAKVFGAPRENNFGKKQWSIELEPDAASRKILKEAGLSKKLRDPIEGDTVHKNSYISFYHDAKMADGTAADPIRVVNSDGQTWTKEDGLIGNGSIVDIKFVVKDYGPGKQKGVYIRAIRVMKLVAFVPQEFAPIGEDDEFFAGETGDTGFATLPDEIEPTPRNFKEDLDDDVPY